MNTTQTVWTPVAVMRRGQPAWLAVKVQWDQLLDRLTVAIDGRTRSWYRRGQQVFNSRRECVTHLRHENLFPMAE